MKLMVPRGVIIMKTLDVHHRVIISPVSRNPPSHISDSIGPTGKSVPVHLKYTGQGGGKYTKMPLGVTLEDGEWKEGS